MDIIPVCEDSYGTVCTCITDGVIGADLAMGRGSSPPYRFRVNGTPSLAATNFCRYGREEGEALEVEDDLSSLLYEFLDPPLITNR